MQITHHDHTQLATVLREIADGLAQVLDSVVVNDDPKLRARLWRHINGLRNIAYQSEKHAAKLQFQGAVYPEASE